MRPKILVFITLLLPVLAVSQDFREGYIVKPGNDTLRGLISYRSGRSILNCEFRSDKKSDVQVFTPDELVSFEIDLSLYETIMLDTDSLPKGNVFMNVLARGEVDLYRYRRIFFLYRDSLIGLPEPLLVAVRRPGDNSGAQYKKKDSRFVVILNQIVQDCGLNANETGYDQKDMSRLVTDYNVCKNNRVIINRRQGFKVNPQIFVGYGASKMDYSYEKISIPFGVCRRPTFGAALDLSSPVLSDRLFLALELWYSQRFYQGYHERPFAGGTLMQDFLLDMTYLKVPVGIRFQFAGRNSTPYIKGGLAFSLLPKSDLTVVTKIRYADGSIHPQENYDAGYYVKTNTRRLWIGTGYTVQLEKFQLFAELRGEIGGGFIGDFADSKGQLVEVNLIAGIRL